MDRHSLAVGPFGGLCVYGCLGSRWDRNLALTVGGARLVGAGTIQNGRTDSPGQGNLAGWGIAAHATAAGEMLGESFLPSEHPWTL